MSPVSNQSHSTPLLVHKKRAQGRGSPSGNCFMCAGNKPNLDASALTYAILGVAVGLKVGLYLVCVTLRRESDTMMALAEDHLNDIFSNCELLY